MLTYREQAPDYDEIEAACLLDAYGAVDELAAQGLCDAGWDVAFVEVVDVAVIRTHLEDDQPLIALLPVGVEGDHSFAHAVVVCGLCESTVTLMDPARGDYVDLELATLHLITSLGSRGIRITGVPGAQFTSK